MTIKIEKGVPIPVRPGTRETLYPFGEMLPGDSFAVVIPDGKTPTAWRARLTGSSHAWAKRHAPGAKFTTRVEEGGGSIRIWLLTKPVLLDPTARVVTPPTVRTHVLSDVPPSAKRKQFEHDIPSFTNGGKARAVTGKRY